MLSRSTRFLLDNTQNAGALPTSKILQANAGDLPNLYIFFQTPALRRTYYVKELMLPPLKMSNLFLNRKYPTSAGLKALPYVKFANELIAWDSLPT